MDFKAIEQAIRDEIANPKGCYMPNSPAVFVKGRLHNMGLHQEALWFWRNIACSMPQFGIESLDRLLPTLNSLDAKERMPEWGTQGT